MEYPVELRQDGKFVMVTFPDIPEAHTQGDSINDALAMAPDALMTALDFYFETDRKIPAPSTPKKRQHAVALPSSVAARVLKWNAAIKDVDHYK